MSELGEEPDEVETLQNLVYSHVEGDPIKGRQVYRLMKTVDLLKWNEIAGRFNSGS